MADGWASPLETAVPPRSRHERVELVRLVLVAIAFVALVIVCLAVRRWFDVRGGGGRGYWGLGTFTIDLRSVTIEHCASANSTPFWPSCHHSLFSVPRGVGLSSNLANETWYPTFALVTWWASVVFTMLVLFQTGARVIADVASRTLTRIGWIAGLFVADCAIVTGYVVIPNIDSNVVVERTATPALLVLAAVIGCAVLRLAATRRVQQPPVTIPRARAL